MDRYEAAMQSEWMNKLKSRCKNPDCCILLTPALETIIKEDIELMKHEEHRVFNKSW